MIAQFNRFLTVLFLLWDLLLKSFMTHIASISITNILKLSITLILETIQSICICYGKKKKIEIAKKNYIIF